MRRKLLIALLGLGVFAGYGGEIYRIRQFHKNGGAPFGRSCHRDHCCRGGQRDTAPASAPSTAAPPTAEPAAAK